MVVDFERLFACQFGDSFIGWGPHGDVFALGQVSNFFLLQVMTTDTNFCDQFRL